MSSPSESTEDAALTTAQVKMQTSKSYQNIVIGVLFLYCFWVRQSDTYDGGGEESIEFQEILLAVLV